MHEYLPWPRLMEISYGALGMTPEEFWAMTPCEFLCALRGFKHWNGVMPQGKAMTQDELQGLSQCYPDVIARAVSRQSS
jgi:uncharacterized phage protein (TIGR02216 family)